LRPAKNIKKIIKNAMIYSNAKVNRAVLTNLLQELPEVDEQTPALAGSNIRRITMKGRITKIAAAAVIITVVILGLFEFIDTDKPSGVVWAEVAKKVETSRGLIVRCTGTSSFLPSEEDYSIKYFSPTHSRTDHYKGGQVTHSYYDDLNTMTLTAVYHTHKHYMTTKFTTIEGFLEQQEDWMNPRYLVQKILSCEHTKLGQKTIEGKSCEGIETTDPAVLGPLPEPVSRLDVQMRLWVDAESKYPIMFESRITGEIDGKVLTSESVMEKFQWDKELDPNIFEPNIPPDYVSMRDL